MPVDVVSCMLACDIIWNPQYHRNDATRGAINYLQVLVRITRLFDVEFAALLTCCVWIVREEYLLPEGFGLSVPRGDERFVAISAAAATVKEFVFEILLPFFFKEKKTSPSESEERRLTKMVVLDCMCGVYEIPFSFSWSPWNSTFEFVYFEFVIFTEYTFDYLI